MQLRLNTFCMCSSAKMLSENTIVRWLSSSWVLIKNSTIMYLTGLHTHRRWRSEGESDFRYSLRAGVKCGGIGN